MLRFRICFRFFLSLILFHNLPHILKYCNIFFKNTSSQNILIMFHIMLLTFRLLCLVLELGSIMSQTFRLRIFVYKINIFLRTFSKQLQNIISLLQHKWLRNVVISVSGILSNILLVLMVIHVIDQSHAHSENSLRAPMRMRRCTRHGLGLSACSSFIQIATYQFSRERRSLFELIPIPRWPLA